MRARSVSRSARQDMAVGKWMGSAVVAFAPI